METRNLRPAYSALFFLTGLALGVGIVFIAVWLQRPFCKDCTLNYFSNIYLVLALFGALLGFVRLRNSRLKVTDPRRLAPTLFCVGLLLWSFGNMLWMSFNFLGGEPVPYPSVADAVYFPNLLFWTVGICILYKIAHGNPLQEMAALAPLLVAGCTATVWLMLVPRGGLPPLNSTEDWIKFALDVGYPIIGAINMALLITLILGPTFEKLSLEMKKAILVILAGVFCMFVADIAFAWTTLLPKSNPFAYFNGNLVDALYATALYLLSVGMLLVPLTDTDTAPSMTPSGASIHVLAKNNGGNPVVETKGSPIAP
jgi:hypothetical protein